MICICVVWETLGRSGSECNSSVRCVQQKLASVSVCPRILLPNSPFQYSDHSSFCSKTVCCCFSPCLSASVSPGCANDRWYLAGCASFPVPGLLLLLSSVEDQLCVMQFTRPPTLPEWLDCTLLSPLLTSIRLPECPLLRSALTPSHRFLKLCPEFVFSTFWLLILFFQIQ